ncbi:MAG: SdrD B-like domain-containing protein [Cyanobacteria bacterium P01_F01_bin.56]
MIDALNSLVSLLPGQVTVKAAAQPNLRDGGDGVGDPSYFDIEIEDNGSILSGKLDAFCIDADNPLNYALIDFNNNGVYGESSVPAPNLSDSLGFPTGSTYTEGAPSDFTATVYSSYDPAIIDGLPNELGEKQIENPQNFDLVNWILNNTGTGQALEGFTVAEIQFAIWELLDDGLPGDQGVIDVSNALYGGSDAANVAQIVQLAQANGEGFEPGAGQKIAIVLVPDGNNDGALDTDADGVPDGNADAQIIITAIELAKLGDFVFEDADADGIQDAGEQGIEGATVNLLADIDGDGVIENDEVVDTTTTDANGKYHFTVLPGDYKVQFETPDGFDMASPANQGGDDAVDSDGPISDVVSLDPGEEDPTIDAGFFKKAALGDKVFFDDDRDGIQDAGEAGVAGVTVTLTGGGADGVIGTSDDTTTTQTTDANGEYRFDDLNPGEEYKVTFSDLPDGFEFTDANQGGDDAADSDADPTNGMTQVVTLAPGEFNPTLDAGIVQQLAGLGDKVFFDDDRDGIQDAGEQGVEGVTVTLTGGGADGMIGNADDTTETIVTDADGMYRFDNLNPGEEYKVTFSDLPDGFEFTDANQGSDDAADSDADPTNGMTQTVTLAPGEFNPTLDAGIVEIPKNPDIDIEKFVNGSDADTVAEAIKVAAGKEVTFTYAVKNTGDVAFTADEVVVIDDNGTPGDASDDFTPDFVEASDLNDNGLLDVGETWLYTKSEAAQDLTTATDSQDVRFYFDGNSSVYGTNGNVRTFTEDGVSVEVSAFSSYYGHFEKAYLGSYTGGLGVTNRYEWSNEHRVDNSTDIDYVVFEFGQDVTVDRAFLDYVGHDSDISVWIGDRDGDITHLDNSVLNSFTKENNFGGRYDRWADFNGDELSGDTVIISAFTGGHNDSFKLKKLDVSVAGETTIGTYHNIATVTATTGEQTVNDSDAANYTNPDEPPFEPTHVLIEAEDMHLCYYKVEHVGDDVASGGEVIKLTGHDGFASTDFTGHSGYYQVDVAYYDENDGHAMGKVKIGGETIDTWTFDQHTSSAFASADNRIVRTVSESIYIEHGDEIKLSGWKDGSEFARFDNIKFTEVEAPQVFHYEAEDLHLYGYTVEHLGGSVASGGEAIKLNGHYGEASTNFAGPTDSYDIIVGYYDENDGEALAQLKVGGQTVGDWQFDELTSSNLPTSDNFREIRFEDVYLETGDQIKLSGWKDYYEFARFDYIKVVGSSDSGSGNGSHAPELEQTDLFSYLEGHAPGLVQAGVVNDTLI